MPGVTPVTPLGRIVRTPHSSKRGRTIMLDARSFSLQEELIILYTLPQAENVVCLSSLILQSPIYTISTSIYTCNIQSFIINLCYMIGDGP